MSVKVTNNAFGTIAANISTVQTVITLAPGQGARFPLLLPADWFWATLVNSGNVIEVVKVTGMAGDSATVTRAQDNTVAFAYSAGDRFELRPTAALFNDKLGVADAAATYLTSAQASTAYYSLAGGQLNGSIVAKTASPTIGFNDTSLPGANGLWEMGTIGGQFDIIRNTDANKLWGSYTVPFSITQGDICQFGQRPTFGGFTPWDTGNFAPSAYLPLSGGNVPGPTTFSSNLVASGTLSVTGGAATGMSTPTGGLAGLMVNAPGAGAAMMAFQRTGSFAAYVGIDVDNQFSIGGWSYGAVRHVFWHDGNLNRVSQLANDAGYGPQVAVAANRVIGGNSPGYGVADVSLEMVGASTVRLVVSYMPNPNPGGGGH